jgi:hypothetical protein
MSIKYPVCGDRIATLFQEEETLCGFVIDAMGRDNASVELGR